MIAEIQTRAIGEITYSRPEHRAPRPGVTQALVTGRTDHAAAATLQPMQHQVPAGLNTTNDAARRCGPRRCFGTKSA
jgi:hypothetical protein